MEAILSFTSAMAKTSGSLSSCSERSSSILSELSISFYRLPLDGRIGAEAKAEESSESAVAALVDRHLLWRQSFHWSSDFPAHGSPDSPDHGSKETEVEQPVWLRTWQCDEEL